VGEPGPDQRHDLVIGGPHAAPLPGSPAPPPRVDENNRRTRLTKRPRMRQPSRPITGNPGDQVAEIIDLAKRRQAPATCASSRRHRDLPTPAARAPEPSARGSSSRWAGRVLVQLFRSLPYPSSLTWSDDLAAEEPLPYTSAMDAIMIGCPRWTTT
jgi:hypothetical protein